jgi:tetratricopeptide (TPR) repeat protein
MAWIELFKHHMRTGTHASTKGGPRPRGSRWVQDELAEATGFDEGKTNVSRESISRYGRAEDLPSEESINHLGRAFFGSDPVLAEEKARFLASWKAAHQEREDAQAKSRTPLAPIAIGFADERPPHYFGKKRKDQVQDLAKLLDQAVKVSVIVLGDGGIGKTTFKREVTHHDGMRARFASRIFEARLETAPGAAAMQNAIATAAGLDPRLDLKAVLDGLSRAGPTLLLLDNLETPWDAEPKPVEALLRSLAATPDVSLLASLRGRVAPLSPLWARQFRLSDLEPEEARAMFRAHAPLVAEDDPHLARFLDELGGNPLAIQLVAGRAAAHETLADLWADWQALGPKLARNSEMPERHRHASLANSIEFSLASRRLDESGRRLFRLLGALPAGIAREDRVVLLGLEKGSDGADQLLRLGLAYTEHDRLDLLPPIRRHALARHAPQGEDAQGWARHLLQLTEELGERFQAHGGEVVVRLRPELPNLEAALRRATVEPELLPYATAAIWTYTVICRWTGLGGLALHSLGDACRSASDLQGEADCIWSLGDIALARSDHAQARERYEAALPLYRQVGDLLGEANCIKSLGDIALARSDHAQAREHIEAALPLYRQLGSLLGEANCIRCLGEIARQLLDRAKARERYASALPLFRQVGDVEGEAEALRGLADLARDEGRAEEARAGYREVLAMEERIGAAGNAAITRARLAGLDG